MLKVLLVTSALCLIEAARPYFPQRYPTRPDYGGRPRPGPYDPESIVFEGNYGRPPKQPSSSPMKVLYSWKQVDFVFPNENTRENMIQTGQFIPKNNLILDVDVFGEGEDRKIFVTLPRVRPGVPVTLATVSSRNRRGVQLLDPYPDWNSNMPSSGCGNYITSVFRTHVDDCGRLWVLDSGNNNAFTSNGSIVCQPQVLIFDVRNYNRLIGKYSIPSSLIERNTLLVTISVDTRQSGCGDAFAYIADSIAYKMIVFNLRTKQFWRINSILFFPYPDWSRFTINGDSFDLSGGIFGLALGPVYSGKRRLYFHCIDSVKQSWVDTADLRNNTLWKDNMNAKPRAFNLFSGTRPSQSAAATMDKEGVMFFGLVASNEIACWNSKDKFTRNNIVRLAKDDKTLQFNSGIKVYNNKLYAATNRLQNYMNNKVNENEENYRILEGDVRQMTRGTKCEVDPLGNRFELEYMPDSESVDHPHHPEFMLSTK